MRWLLFRTSSPESRLAAPPPKYHSGVKNSAGGESTVFDLDGNLLVSKTLSEPGQDSPRSEQKPSRRFVR